MLPRAYVSILFPSGAVEGTSVVRIQDPVVCQTDLNEIVKTDFTLSKPNQTLPKWDTDLNEIVKTDFDLLKPNQTLAKWDLIKFCP